MVFNNLILAECLTNILKDVKFEEVIKILDDAHLRSEGGEVKAYLERYFSQADSVPNIVLEQEAKEINKLFPNYTVKELASRLEILGNEDNRMRIVLRELFKKDNFNYKRLLPCEPELTVNNKKACTSVDIELYNRPTTSKDCSLNRPCTAETVEAAESSTDKQPSVCEDACGLASDTKDENIQALCKRLRKSLCNFSMYVDLVHCLTMTFQKYENVNFYEICINNGIDLSEVPSLIEQEIIVAEMLFEKRQYMETDIADVLANKPVISPNKSSNNKLPQTEVKRNDVDEVLPIPSPSLSNNKFHWMESDFTDEDYALPLSSPKQSKNNNEVASDLEDESEENRNNEAGNAGFPINYYHQPIKSDMPGVLKNKIEGSINANNKVLFPPVSPTKISNWLRAPHFFPNTHGGCRQAANFNKFTSTITGPRFSKPAVAPNYLKPAGFHQCNNACSTNGCPDYIPIFTSDTPVEVMRAAALSHAANQKRRRATSKYPNRPSFFSDMDEFDDWRENLSVSSDSDLEFFDEATNDFFGTSMDNEGAGANLTVPAPVPVPKNNKLASQLMEMFPDACPNYIKLLCKGKEDRPQVVEELVDRIISDTNYPKRAKKEESPELAMDADKQFALLQELFPDADPNYLKYHAELYAENKEELEVFIENTLEKRNYPTIKDYLRKQQLSAQARQYTTEFNIEEFLKVIPDPKKYFSNKERKPALSNTDVNTALERHYALSVMKNIYNMLTIRAITTHLTFNSWNIVKTAHVLDKQAREGLYVMKSKRKVTDLGKVTIQNIPLLQELAYIQHRKDIEVFLKEEAKKAIAERLNAKKNNLLLTCGCCFDDEVMPQDVASCEKGCIFCKECIQKSVEVLFGEGKLDFPCLSSCESYFNLQTLKVVLTPKLFSKMAQKKQLEEIKAAGIEDLESCPFCDFATIPASENKIFHCMNPECMKESCRLCKEPSHVPLRCEEIEKDDDVKRRTYIENKMTEALLRKCYKCGFSFIKSDGCNKMTCSCGAKMCYVCGQPVYDYKHFNGQGGDNFNLCPLYSDTDKLHQDLVLKGAQLAKAEIGVDEDSAKLKIDPTADVEKHYKELQKKNKHTIPPGMLDMPNVVNIPGNVRVVNINLPYLQQRQQVGRNINRRVHRRHLE